jgi:CysZ protein
MYPNVDETTPHINAPTQFVRGAQFFFAGLRLLFRERQLLLLSLVPLLLTVVMLTVLAFLFAWVVSGLLLGLFSVFLGLDGSVAPQFQYGVQLLAFLLGLFLATTVYLPLARVLLAPFSEALSRKTHQLTHSGVHYQLPLGWLRAMWEGLKLVSLQFVVLLFGFAISLILPVAGHLLLVALTVIVCGMDYLDVPLSARGLSLRSKLGLLWRHKALVAGFAASAYLLLLIPFINVLSLPVGVVGATLLTDQLRQGVD